MVGGVQPWKNQIPYWPGGWPTNWRKIIPKKFSHVVKVLNPMSVSPAWGSDKVTGNPQGIWPWRPAGLDYRTSTELGKTDSSLAGNRQNLVWTNTLRKGVLTTQETEQNYLLVLEGILWRHGWAGAHHRDRDISSRPGRSPLALALLEVAINPTTEPVDPRAGSPQAKQLIGTEHNPTQQQIIGLKLYWARPNSSHHQSLPSGSLHNPLRLLHQRADRRSKKYHNPTVARKNHIPES